MAVDPPLKPTAVSTPDPALDTAALSLATIYDQHVDFVWRAMRRLGISLEQIDDAVQDVFLVVHRRLSDFEGRSSLKTWLYGIALRVAQQYRRRAGRRVHQIDLTDTTVDLDALDPHQEACRAEAVQLLDGLLEQLDAPKREIFVLAEVAELKVPEIAETLDINLNTAYARLRAARESFNKAIARYLASRQRRAP